MKVVVAFSGGKDSQASLIWAVKKFGTKNIIAVFCDTGCEHSLTYQHIKEICENLGVELIILKSKKYDGMVDLATKRKRFPASQSRFCTTELKSIPMIDWILEQTEHLLIIQGIRKNESESRSKMFENCRMFKYYFEPYQTNTMIVESFKNIKNPSKKARKKYEKAKSRLEIGKEDEKFHNYRKREIKKWCEKYDDSILRPVFEWSGQYVIDYIIENGQKPNPLYYKGANRVGCFPCIMTSKKELRAMIELTPEFIEKVNQAEIQSKHSFFPSDYVPTKYCSQRSKSGKKYPLISDVVNYLTEFSGNLFEEDENLYNKSCMSFYGICE